MPIRWYFGGFIFFLIWAVVVWKTAPYVPWRARAVELVGTLLTLLPVVLDLLRRYYVHRNAPQGEGPFTNWALEQVRRALLGYEWLYAVAIFVGISLIASGFAMDLTKPEVG